MIAQVGSTSLWETKELVRNLFFKGNKLIRLQKIKKTLFEITQ